MSILARLFFLLVITYFVKADTILPRSATATLRSQNITDGNQLLTGTIVFTETEDGLQIVGNVAGLPEGKYKFQIHELGNIESCVAAGSQLQPAGDIGNMEFANATAGVVSINIVDTVLKLRGKNNILGRSVIVHSETDTSGLGEAATRVACGVIGILSPSDGWNAAVTSSPSMLMFITIAIAAYLRH